MALSSAFLLEARALGLLGPGPVEIHRRHSEGFVEALRRVWFDSERSFDLDFKPGPNGAGTNLLDLGSGGGVPGMIVAELWPSSIVSVLDSSKKRCELLGRWIEEAKWGSRVTVLCGRAEELGRDPELRGRFDAVMARSFGRPSLTAECAAPFLRVDGLLVVSDPPAPQSGEPVQGKFESLASDPPAGDSEALELPRHELASDAHRGASQGLRWPPVGLKLLGLEPLQTITEPFHFTTLRQTEICPDRYPRRTGVPAKRPLF